MSIKKYTCEMCGNSYESGQSDSDAMQEFVNNFGSEFANSDEATAIVCDDCYKIIDPKYHPEKVKKTLEEFYKKRN